MKIAFPHMGTLYIALSSAFKMLGGEVVVPPYNSKRTLSLGTRNSPEAVCLPYKLVLGNYIEAVEAGAEAIVMIDSPGICRLGQYSSSSRVALRDMGYDVEFINFDLYKGKLKELYTKFRKATGNGNPIDLVRAINIAFVKIDILDKLNDLVCYYRAREAQIGMTDKKYRKCIKLIENAMSTAECKKALSESQKILSEIPLDDTREVVNVDLTGEIYVVLDQFSNMEIEKELGKLGVHVRRRVRLSDWTNTFLLPAFLRSAETHGEIAEKHAKEYLKRDIGGDAIESIGDTSLAGKSDTDGVVHLLPFTCMPEIMSQNILPNVRSDKDIPVLSLVLDEQMGKAGFVTRLEAFVDLIRRRKRQKSSLKKNNEQLLKAV